MELYKKYLKPFGWKFTIALLCVMLEAVCDLLGPTLMAKMINEGITTGIMSRVFFWGGLMLGVTAIGAIFAMTRNVLASQVSQRFGIALRQDLFQKILGSAQLSVDELTSGSLITRMTNDTSQVIQFINGLMRIFLKAPIICVGSLVFATLLNWRLSLIVYGVVLLIGLLIYFGLKLSYPRYRKLQLTIDRVNAVVQEYLIGIRLVKAFGTYALEAERFDQANDNLLRHSIKAQVIITLLAPLLTLLIGIGVVLVIGVGGQLFVLGLASAGEVSAFMIYLAQMLTALLMITNIFNIFVRTSASAVRIQEVFDAPGDCVGGLSTTALTGAITFQHVSFTYPSGSGQPVLQDISFAIKPGSTVAIIGPTGSGKTTIVNLLLQLYDNHQGQILLDGQEIRQFEIHHLRRSMALVPQKSMLFAGEVQDNLRWGAPSASDTDLNTALRMAQATFVQQMPQQLASWIGGSAVNLSGGQKQRLSLARGLLKQSPVLLLDDVTSALDALTEAEVRRQLQNRQPRNTLIMVTQKCSTAMFADQILVLEHGILVGNGTNAELMHICPTYQAIYQSQLAIAEEDDE